MKSSFDKAYKEGREFMPFDDELLRRIIKKYNLTGAALEVGCGRGQLCERLADLGFDVEGIDLSSEAIKQARKNNKLGDIDYINGDIEETELQVNFYDLIIVHLTLAFIKDQEALIKKLQAALRPDGIGKLVICTPLHTISETEHEKAISVKPLEDIKPYHKAVIATYVI